MIQRTFIVALTLAALAIGVMWVGSIRWTLAYIGRGYGIGIGEGIICVCEVDAPFVQRAGIELPANATRQMEVTERTHV